MSGNDEQLPNSTADPCWKFETIDKLPEFGLICPSGRSSFQSTQTEWSIPLNAHIQMDKVDAYIKFQTEWSFPPHVHIQTDKVDNIEFVKIFIPLNKDLNCELWKK